MSFREALSDWSKGDQLSGFWLLYRLRAGAKYKLARDIWTLLLNRCA